MVSPMTAPGFLDLSDPAFSTRGPSVAAARARFWCARTPYGIAVLRWREVGLLLRDRRLRQGSHAWPARTGLTGPFADFWRRSVIGREGADHRRLRDLITPVLSEGFVAAMIPTFDAIAADLTATLGAGGPDGAGGRCEFQSAFADPFAGRAIAALLGLPQTAWRRVAADAVSLGLAMGVEAARHKPRIDAAYLRLDALAAELVANARRRGDGSGFVGALAARFDAGKEAAPPPDQALLDLIVIAIFGGVDTTRSQLGLGLSLFIDHPDQWAALRADPALIAPAVEEMIAARPTTTWVTREPVEDFTFGDVTFRAGETVHLLVHASARDPAVFAGDGFDIRARRKRHFGFGGGAHHCIGFQMARTDMAAALRALSGAFRHVAYDGEPDWAPDSGNTSPRRLPVRFEAG